MHVVQQSVLGGKENYIKVFRIMDYLAGHIMLHWRGPKAPKIWYKKEEIE